MELLKKYATKKKIFMSAFIYSAVYAAIWLISNLMTSGVSTTDYSSMVSLVSTLASMITVFQIIFYVMLAAAIVIAVLAGVYFFTKDKSDYVMLGEFIGYGISSILLVFSVSGINALCKVIKVYSSGNYSSALTMDYISMVKSVETALNCMDYFRWIMIIMFVLNVFVLLVMKNVIKLSNFSYSLVDGVTTGNGEIIGYDPQTGKPIYQQSNNPGNTTVRSGEGLTNIKDFFKTKNGKITLGVIVAVIVTFGGYKIYDTFFNKTTIRLLENVEVEFNGYDGAGRVSSCRIGDVEYDKTNAEIASFVNSVTLSYDKADELKNGDEIEVTATYNQTTAEELKLDVQDATVKVKVKGLTERYKKASEVPHKTSSAIKKSMDEEMKNDYDSRQSDYYSYKTSFVSMYYAYDKENTYSPSDYCIGVYKVEYNSNYGSTPKTETFYAIAYINGVNSSYSTKEKKSIYTTNLQNTSYEKVTDESQIQSAIEKNYRFDDHTITKFN